MAISGPLIGSITLRRSQLGPGSFQPTFISHSFLQMNANVDTLTYKTVEATLMYKNLYKPAPLKQNFHTCLICKNDKKQDISKGYTNLKNHLTCHGEAANVLLRQNMSLAQSQTLLDIVHAWIEAIVQHRIPFTFPSSQWAKDHVRIHGMDDTAAAGTKSSLSVNTLKGYIDELVRLVEIKISNELPDKFGIVMDGWTSFSGDHYMALFATYTDGTGIPRQTMLAMSPMGNELKQDPDAIIEFMEDVLTMFFGKNIQNVAFLISDTPEVNRSVARKLGIPFVGCMNHRLNLAVKHFLEEGNHHSGLKAVNDLMISLKNSCKRRVGLRMENTKLLPVIRNDTRWTSTFQMLTRFFEPTFERAVGRIANNPKYFRTVKERQTFQDLVPANRRRNSLFSLFECMKAVNEATVALQAANNDVLDAELMIRLLLERVNDPNLRQWIRTYCTDQREHSKVPESVSFLSGVRKVLDHEMDLDAAEVHALRCLKRKKIAEVELVNKTPIEMSIAEAIEKERALKKRKFEQEQNGHENKGRYIDLRCVLAGAAVCERLFSIARHVVGDHCSSLLPRTLETILFLRMNHRLWNKESVAEVVMNPKKVQVILEVEKENENE
jgi:hypothetical protein